MAWITSSGLYPNCGGEVEKLGTDASGWYEYGECVECGATVYERADGYDEAVGYGS